MLRGSFLHKKEPGYKARVWDQESTSPNGVGADSTHLTCSRKKKNQSYTDIAYCVSLAWRHDQTDVGRPISQHVSNNWSHAHHNVWPHPFISLLLCLEGPIGVLFTPIPSTQKRSFPSKRSTLWKTLWVNKVGYNCTLKEKGDMLAKTDKCDWTLLRGLSDQSLDTDFSVCRD